MDYPSLVHMDSAHPDGDPVEFERRRQQLVQEYEEMFFNVSTHTSNGRRRQREDQPASMDYPSLLYIGSSHYDGPPIEIELRRPELEDEEERISGEITHAINGRQYTVRQPRGLDRETLSRILRPTPTPTPLSRPRHRHTPLLRPWDTPPEYAATAAAVADAPPSKRARVPASDKAILGLREVTGSSGECAICLQDFDDSHRADLDETPTKLRAMPCSHAFHQHCIFEWLHRNAVCPLCRYQLPTDED